MTRILLAATTALTLTAGVALAQTTTETTTTESTVPAYTVPAPVQVPATVSQTTTQRTVDGDGVVTAHTKTVTSGTTLSPYGDTAITTKKTVETTTTR